MQKFARSLCEAIAGARLQKNCLWNGKRREAYQESCAQRLARCVSIKQVRRRNESKKHALLHTSSAIQINVSVKKLINVGTIVLRLLLLVMLIGDLDFPNASGHLRRHPLIFLLSLLTLVLDK